jgi:uncharacterized protein YecE (DUF72 family)
LLPSNSAYIGSDPALIKLTSNVSAARTFPSNKSQRMDRSNMARVLIGTSGWHYASWRGPFFPEGVTLKQQLSYYAGQFDTTELNGVFYRTPTPEAVKGWREQTGGDFVFAWKASKFITHWKRLSDRSVNSLELLEDRISRLGGKAGPILFQLPPQFEADADRLAGFFKLLSRKRRYSFEFRHPSWYQPRILRMLADENISLCLSDHHDAPAPWKRTADFVYVRGHGPSGRYHGHYTKPTLAQWARRIKSWKRQGCDVFVYFDNDQKSAAPADAQALKQLLNVRQSAAITTASRHAGAVVHR